MAYDICLNLIERLKAVLEDPVTVPIGDDLEWAQRMAHRTLRSLSDWEKREILIFVRRYGDDYRDA